MNGDSALNLILTGATGFAGGEVLRQALEDPRVARVMVLTRRPSGRTHPKLVEHIQADFRDYTGVDFAGWDACIWALGVSQTAVDEAQYIVITHDYALAASRAMWAANPDLRFCFLSGRGADQQEQARTLFGRIKGRTERELAALSPNVTSFRPTYIKPTRATGPRRDFARYLAPIGTVMSWISDSLSVDCDRLARCMIDVAKGATADPVLDNHAIRAWPNRPG